MSLETVEPPREEDVTRQMPKDCKENRYYYRHREEIRMKRLQKRMEDPEYAEKYKKREEAKAKRAEQKKVREERIKAIAEQFLLPRCD